MRISQSFPSANSTANLFDDDRLANNEKTLAERYPAVAG